MKYQRQTIHAVAQAGWLGAVVKHMTEMAAAAPAMNFGPQHSKHAVFCFAHGIFERSVKTRPTSATFELRLRGEQRQVATGAGEDALPMLFEQRARAWPLGALLAQNLVLLWA